MTQTRAAADVLKRIPIFANCPADELSALESSLEYLEIPANDVIFREGEPGDSMFVIGEGQVKIVSDVETEKVVFANLGTGDFFGEMALLTGAPRSGGAVAGTDVRLWRIARTAFEGILHDHPSINAEISRVLGERIERGNHRRFQNEAFTLVTLTPERRDITIGRSDQNDVVIDDPQVSAVHARIRASESGWEISDEGSNTGTYVNRRRVTVASLNDGDEILIGTNKMFVDGATVKGFVEREGLRIDVIGLGKVVGHGKRILNDVSLSIHPGEFVAVVGGSGAGKSTFLHALSGFSPATEGAVEYNQINLYENLGLFRSLLGYVPQDDIVHAELTVERTLHYAAKLRLPNDTTKDEIHRRIDEVLAVVGLDEHRKTTVKRLSGGQRKRVSVALELLARPKALFLDEPTSGLDPALEGRMMALFGSLAEQGATVLVTTHSTQNLRMCDKIAWFAPGGHLTFFGSPAEALRHFGVRDFGEVYPLLDSEDSRAEWMQKFEESPAYATNVKERRDVRQMPRSPQIADAATSPRPAGLVRQLYWLTRRYAEVLMRDTLNFALLLFQAPAIAVALLFLFNKNIFAGTAAEGGDALRGLMAFHIITASAIFLGASNAAREITKESAIYARERLVNLTVVPYVMSKVIVLSLLCLFQAAVLIGIFMLRMDLPGSEWDLFPTLLAAVFLTELAGLAMGLLVSASVANSDRAMAIVPVLLIPQLIFAGALVPVDRMLVPAKVLSQLMISKWALQLTGRLAHLDTLFAPQFPDAFARPYENGFDVPGWLPWAVLSAFVVLMLAATIVVQKRKDVI
ncbi:MAG TPA: ATP-binding cassette domain-containing protein [Dehalococcoidia bacterium]